MSQESNALDEAFGSAGRSVRMSLMMGGQAAEMVARRVAEHQRRAAEEGQDRAGTAQASFEQSRATAREAYQPVANARGFATADQETAVAAWATARAWAEVDPSAARAEAELAEQIKERWGIDAEDLFPSEAGAPDLGDEDEPVLPDDERSERFAQAMDPQWREDATDAELERLWHETNNAGDDPAAAILRDVLDQDLAERHGVDLDRFHQQLEQGLGEDLWHAGNDRAALDADEAAEGYAERQAAGWGNEADGQHSREATAETEGEEIEESVDAREAEGLASAWLNEAEAERGEARGEESRADAAEMNAYGVPPRSQDVRNRTARGFGTSTHEGIRAKARRWAKKHIGRKDMSPEKGMSR